MGRILDHLAVGVQYRVEVENTDNRCFYLMRHPNSKYDRMTIKNLFTSFFSSFKLYTKIRLERQLHVAPKSKSLCVPQTHNKQHRQPQKRKRRPQQRQQQHK
jgi:hypothetical protein